MPAAPLSSEEEATPGPALLRTGREAIEATLTYYAAMGRLFQRSVEALLPAVVELRPKPRPAPARPAGPAGEGARRTMVVEAEAGHAGLGVFLVENATAERVSAPPSVSAFSDGSGGEVAPAVKFSPEVVTLEAGEQALVQVAVTVDKALEPGVRYGATISIPGLSAATVPIVLRRRPRPTRVRTPAKPAAQTRRR